MSQNRQHDIDRRARGETRYRINVKADLEIELLLRRSTKCVRRPSGC
ncbi:DUF1003 domain-containing protein [Bradyrhizobium sp. Rc2d]|nr:DUF1003 domain-containing protein [Bradyrhizobium sp. Rc2d]